MDPSTVNSKRGGWWQRQGLGSAVHYFPPDEMHSTCGLASFWGRWEWRKVRRRKHGVCELCERRFERWHSTTVNSRERRTK